MNLRDEFELLSKPGDTIMETMLEKKLTIIEVAGRMGLETDRLQEIINAKMPITGEVAGRLEKALEIPADFWINRELNYREKLGKLRIAAARQGKALGMLASQYYNFVSNIANTKMLFPGFAEKLKPLLLAVNEIICAESTYKIDEDEDEQTTSAAMQPVRDFFERIRKEIEG